MWGTQAVAAPPRPILLPFAVRVVVVVGAALGAALLSGSVQPVDLLLAGETGPSAAVIAADFPGHPLVHGPGYDGQQYYAVAARLPDLDAASAALDSPRYRLGRILAPAIASLAPSGNGTVLALLVLNIAGLGLACGALAELCQRRGWPAAFGVLATVPLALALLTTTVDPLSTGLILSGLAFVSRGRLLGAAGLFALALLTREALLIVVVLVALASARQDRRGRPLTLLLSTLPLLAWHLYLSTRISGPISSQTEVLAVLHGPPSLIISFLVCMALAAAAGAAWRTESAVAAAAAAYLLQMPLFGADIDWKALPRVSAPAVALGLAATAGWLLERSWRPTDTR